MCQIIENEQLIELFKNPPKITIIEGPDSAGKSTLSKKLVNELGPEFEVKILRFPDNRGNVKLRDTILNSDISTYNLGHVFLFLADFVHAYEQYIKPYLEDDLTVFIFDRFVPSVGIYQQLPIDWINHIFSHPKFKDFFEVFMDAQYIYLDPVDFNEHKRRINSRNIDDINCLDPVGEEAVKAQILTYRKFKLNHLDQKLIGSNKVITIEV